MDNSERERKSLILLREIQEILAGALNQLGGKTTQGKASLFACKCIHANNILEGYCTLREGGRIYASKMMVRPVIETTFGLVAALKHPGFLFKKAYSEYREDINLIKEGQQLAEGISNDPNKKAEILSKYQEHMTHAEIEWQQFKIMYLREHPDEPIKEQKVNVPESAKAAKLDAWYMQYRFYCQFTHGTLRAASGAMDETSDSMDNHIMIWLSLILLNEYNHNVAPVTPDLTSYWKDAELIWPNIS